MAYWAPAWGRGNRLSRLDCTPSTPSHSPLHFILDHSADSAHPSRPLSVHTPAIHHNATGDDGSTQGRQPTSPGASTACRATSPCPTTAL
ncbi:hypothetical protein PsYK624_169600 [Phanerochaete sordida]|uniref:Uncharacterized protein n=1 Tax=Phanerochaete sordida TaxID=48140 RepID=A0A9P3LMB8_9APHY|nr:hypothetical protein PsYK624_169600 [Phanerochaete sordida]